MVLKARHRRMDRLVALKVLSPALVKTKDLVGRFQREVKAAARLSHPHIVTAYDADEVKGTHFLVMEYVPGTDLGSLVRKQGMLPVATAIEYTLQTARGFLPGMHVFQERLEAQLAGRKMPGFVERFEEISAEYPEWSHAAHPGQ